MSQLLSNRRFKFLHGFVGGHKVFFDVQEQAVAIADQSGNRPDQTDDGILWLHPSRVGGEIKFRAEKDGELYSSPMPKDESLTFSMLIGLLEDTNTVSAINTLHKLQALSYGLVSLEEAEADEQVH